MNFGWLYDESLISECTAIVRSTEPRSRLWISGEIFLAIAASAPSIAEKSFLH